MSTSEVLSALRAAGLQPITASTAHATQETGFHVFRIHGFTEKVANGVSVVSDKFSVGGHDWRIKCFPNGRLEADECHISLFLMHDSHAKTGDATATYKISILDKAWKPSSPCTFNSSEGNRFRGTGHGYPKFMKLKDLDKEQHLKDDCLSVLCDVSVHYTHEPNAVASITSTPGLLCAIHAETRQQITASTVTARQATGSHIFRIEGFSRVREMVANGSAVTSRRFSVGGHDWRIQCYPNGNERNSKGCISLYLIRHGKIGHATATYKMSILDMELKPSCTKISPQGLRFTNYWGLLVYDYGGWEEFIKHEDLDKEKHLKDDCLSILCDVTVDLGHHTTDYDGEIVAAEEPIVTRKMDLNKQAGVNTKVSDRHTMDAHWWQRLFCCFTTI